LSTGKVREHVRRRWKSKRGFEKDGTGVTGLIDGERISNLVAGNGTVRAL
jgi:hypothetical protein